MYRGYTLWRPSAGRRSIPVSMVAMRALWGMGLVPRSARVRRGRVRASLCILAVAALAAAHTFAQEKPQHPAHSGGGGPQVSWVPSSPQAGDSLTVFFQGLRFYGIVDVVLRDTDSGQIVDSSAVAASQGFAILQLPNTGGRYRIALVNANAPQGAPPLYRSHVFTVGEPPYQLDAPPAADPGASFIVGLGRIGGVGDTAQIVSEGGITASPLQVTPVDGLTSVSFTAPQTPGTYDIQIISGSDGSVLASTSIVVGSGSDPGGTASTGCGTSPDAASLRAAFDNAVQSYLAQAEAMYGGKYQDLQYNVQIVSADIGDGHGTVVASYSGSATEISTGKVDASSGTVSASFQWQGCSWTMSGFTY